MQTYQQIAHTEAFGDLHHRLALAYPHFTVIVDKKHNIDIYHPAGAKSDLGLFIEQQTRGRMGRLADLIHQLSGGPHGKISDSLNNAGALMHEVIDTQIKNEFIKEIKKLKLEPGEYYIDPDMVNGEGWTPFHKLRRQEYI